MSGRTVTTAIDIAMTAGAAVAAVVCLAVARRHIGRSRSAWILFGAASIAWGFGNAIRPVSLLASQMANVVVLGLGAAAIVQLKEVFDRQIGTIDRLRSVDDMKNDILRAVSHELRTPLTVIQGTASFLDEQGSDMDLAMRQQLYSAMVRNAERLDDLVSGLLDLERLTRGVIEPERQMTDMYKVFESVTQNVYAEHHTIVVRCGHIRAHVDPGQVERIVENLVSNAVRHTPAGTTVTASAERVPDGVLIVVEDDGPGVPRDVRDQIFQPFVQTEASQAAGQGTGIGLSLVAKFAEVHGGRAWVEDAKGGGARFCVFLADDLDAPGPASADDTDAA